MTELIIAHSSQNVFLINLNMLWGLVMCVVVIWVVQRRWVMRRQRALANQLKTNLKSWPILGHTYMFLGTETDRIEAIHDLGRDALEQGGVSKLMYFDQLFINAADPAVAEVLLRECLEKHDLMKVIGFLINNSSIIATVPIWRPRRKAITPIFNSMNLVQFAKVISKHADAMVDLLQREADNKRTFCFWEYTSTFAFNSVCENVMGVEIISEGSEFMTAIEKLWDIAGYVSFRPWLKNEFMVRFIPRANYHKNRDVVWNFTKKVIKEKRDTIEKKKSQKLKEENNTTDMSSFLARQLEAPEHQRLSDKELLEECISLLVAGFDTSATITAFIAMMLSRHPNVQDKVYEELQEVLGESDRPVSHEDLPRLMYLDAVIRETLRLYPIAPITVRQVNKDVKLPSGLTVVKGCGVAVNIWAVNRNPAYWGPDADQFRPERFLNYTLKHPAAFLSFSFGPRNCVASEEFNHPAGYRYAMISLKIAVASLVRRYRVLPPPGVQRGEPLRTAFNFLLKHADNYQIRLEKRNQKQMKKES